MSASLVGSEMCIRDRTRSVAVAECLLTIGKQPCIWQSRQFSFKLALVQTCLLYTSDAADDM
eukprot:7845838-Alexandrium_andersonii.AAC.1